MLPWEVCEEISLQYFGQLNIYKSQFTFGITYQNTLCLDVKWIFNLFPYIWLYNTQYFEPIEYVNGLSRSSPIFQVNDPKVHIDVDDFSIFFRNQ
jgi:hypothetical protein